MHSNGMESLPPATLGRLCSPFLGGCIRSPGCLPHLEGLMVCRFLLAILEAMYGPAVPLLSVFFYPRKRLGLRVGLFLSGSALANAYDGALAYSNSQAQEAASSYVLCFIRIFLCAFISDLVGVQGPFIAGAGLIAAVGYILLATQKIVAVRYSGLFLATIIFTSVALVLP
jgi:hypothetical protein